ncbi:MAG: hypothetical protein IKN24_03220 [Lachnospiraceae bacterium]|nr:hypothetical protein [Lachnospiraceae bacterium]
MEKNNGTGTYRDEYTEYIYDEACFGEPLDAQEPGDLTRGIELALKLDNDNAFLEGVCRRLNELGDDTAAMLECVKKRYRSVLGTACPRTVVEWMRGTTPGMVNRRNNYELCMALEMDYDMTADFFRRSFLSIPFIAKSRVDAVFMYILYHGRSYADAARLLAASENYELQEGAHTATSQIMRRIIETEDDEAFLTYLRTHCYGSAQQFLLAKEKIAVETELVKKSIREDASQTIASPDRLNSMTIEALLGYRYQLMDRAEKRPVLPKRFTESLPNEITLGQILGGKGVSYELLRKTLLLLHFYNFYSRAENIDPRTIGGNLMDFYDEADELLESCGFARLYMRHPFDCLLLYCANSYDPILTMHYLNEKGD